MLGSDPTVNALRAASVAAVALLISEYFRVPRRGGEGRRLRRLAIHKFLDGGGRRRAVVEEAKAPSRADVKRWGAATDSPVS